MTEIQVIEEVAKFRKLKLLVFTGEDSIGRGERYFNINNIIESEKLAAMAVCL